MTVILECLTALLEYIDLFTISSGRGEQMFGGAYAPLGPTIDMPLSDIKYLHQGHSIFIMQ